MLIIIIIIIILQKTRRRQLIKFKSEFLLTFNGMMLKDDGYIDEKTKQYRTETNVKPGRF